MRHIRFFHKACQHVYYMDTRPVGFVTFMGTFFAPCKDCIFGRLSFGTVKSSVNVSNCFNSAASALYLQPAARFIFTKLRQCSFKAPRYSKSGWFSFFSSMVLFPFWGCHLRFCILSVLMSDIRRPRHAASSKIA